ncbi:class I SAM-dependent methyltransferase [Flavobacterium celericrescens]|uniref:Methyltransferase domain-containing protein n=1 Tax=Flavobacterium celericrescens TaxID=2709780 RepID=A0ABX0IGQ4_9FLAO|nr:class I SAM-dependent methyltransferase [Flavobacterium celericrescens]NHM05563.1 methyltransferase domain-containing protein [Flavobacterium celericrescens]
MENTKKQHWETVFITKAENEVSWFQEQPQTSIQLIQACKVAKDAKIIDIGGGDSYLIDSLLDFGYTNLFLLDISEAAIKRAKLRLGEKAKHVTFVVSDSLHFHSDEKFDVWHDRASFHFFTEASDIEQYKNNVIANTNQNAHLIIGTFSEDGPLKCSGLPITQYSVDKMEAVFGQDFELENCFTEDHETPFNTVQNFIFCHYMKK